MTYRVVQWSVGGVGQASLRALLASSDFEVVGVYTHGESRVGHDAGDLVGLGTKTGIRGTSDVDHLLDLHPDCVVFTSTGETPQTGGRRACPDPLVGSKCRFEFDDEPDLSTRGGP